MSRNIRNMLDRNSYEFQKTIQQLRLSVRTDTDTVKLKT